MRQAAAGLVLVLVTASLSADQWPRFRGPDAAGVADGQALPVRWNVADGTNVRWKARLPGLGHSSPIVWGERLFVTAAVADSPAEPVLGDKGGIALVAETQPHSWRVLCLSAADGRVLWDREADAGRPPVKRHVKASQANATPATDGNTVVAIFPTGLFAFQAKDGRPKWRADLGRLDPGLLGDTSSEWGHASSPVLFENLVIVQVDRHAGSFLAAYDLDSGKQAWRVARDERPVWATPLVHRAGGAAQLVVIGGNSNRGYDPRTGRELWSFKDEAEVKTPSPFAADDLLVFAGGYRGRPMFALRPGSAKAAWTTEQGGPYTTTPVAYQGLLYGVRDEGIAFAYDMRSGERVWRERTGATHSASLLASDGKLYLAAEGGEVLVLKAGRSFELLARNDMGEPCMATPAIADGTLYVRTRGHLYAIAAPRRASAGVQD